MSGSKQALAVAPEVVTYVESEISKLPIAKRCAAALALGATGLLLGALGAFGYVSPAWAALGASIVASSAVLIREFCGIVLPTAGA